MQHDFILLDRSGSMSMLWGEALASINSYAKGLADQKVDTGITVVTFDQHNGKNLFEVIRDRITAETFKPLDQNVDQIFARGTTPLSDSVGKIVALANAGGYDKVAIIIMTDGQENASREYSVAAAKALLDQCRAKGWQVIFLGANFDNASQADSYGNAASMSARVAPGKMARATAVMSNTRARYGVSGQSMDFTDEDKADLASAGDPAAGAGDPV